MKNLNLIKDSAFLGVINNKGFLNNWVLIPVLKGEYERYNNYQKRD
ncbi:MAG: hypothetical protein ABIK81_03015 [candidate division WOR-3 bacterium]